MNLDELAARATAWADALWDDEVGLLWNPPGSFDGAGIAPRSVHLVPQSAWYAVGLLARGDTEQAERVLRALCALQYDRPGAVWHGTFARFAEWPHPRADGAIEWLDYDPNWRQFLGTAMAVILQTYDLAPDVAAAMRGAIATARAGEPQDRIAPSYTNVALMHAWLARDERLARAVVDDFTAHGAFSEHGSPTYYGVDLFGLALWRRHAPTPRFAEWGDLLWDGLWADIARWWHPGMGNLCGPYSRSYGMDMSAYVALLGLWLPDPVVPDLAAPFEHGHDLLMAPLVALLGGGPTDLELTDAPRLVEQALPDHRVATGWISPEVMLGAERGARYRAEGQYHPATAHWLLEDGTVGWLRLRHRGPLSATAGEGTLTVAVHDHRRLGRQPVIVETSHPGRFEPSAWPLHGRTIGYHGPPVSESGVIDAGSNDVLTLRFD